MSTTVTYDNAISIENCFELSTTLVRFYQLLQQQQQQQQQQIMQQPQQYCINENQNCVDQDLDENNRIENSFINENRQFF